MILAPEQYPAASTYDLLRAIERGFVPLDHRALHAIVDNPEKSIPDLVRFASEEHPDGREDLTDDLIHIFSHLRTPQALPFLTERLRQTHEEADFDLIAAFQDIGAPAVDPLLELYRELERDEESDVAFVLASLGVRDTRIFEALIRRIDIDATDAAHCLASYGDPAAIPALRAAVERIKPDDEWMARSIRTNIEALESGPPPPLEPELFDLWSLYPAESDPNFELLTEAEIELFLDSPDFANRYAAAAYISGGDVPRRLWDKFFDMARRDPEPSIRGECWRALRPALDRIEIRDAMRARLDDESASAEERAGALSSLASHEGARPEIQRWIAAFYEQPSTRSYGLHAMAVSLEPRFEPYFREHLEDPDDSIALQAILGVTLNRMESEARRLPKFFEHPDLRQDALYAYSMLASAEPSRAGMRRLYQKIEDLAAGFSDEEEVTVKSALNSRAGEEGCGEVFDESGNPVEEPRAVSTKIGRNEPCPCGSGKKYKKCCGA